MFYVSFYITLLPHFKIFFLVFRGKHVPVLRSGAPATGGREFVTPTNEYLPAVNSGSVPIFVYLDRCSAEALYQWVMLSPDRKWWPPV